MQDSDWHWDEARAVGVFLNGQAITEPDREGDPVTDDSFLILLNGHHEPSSSGCPERRSARSGRSSWTRSPDGEARPGLRAHDSVHIEARSTLVLIRP